MLFLLYRDLSGNEIDILPNRIGDLVNLKYM